MSLSEGLAEGKGSPGKIEALVNGGKLVAAGGGEGSNERLEGAIVRADKGGPTET